MTRHGVLYFLARVGAGVMSTVALALLTRLLDPASYGSYTLAVTSATIAGTLLFQWLTVAVGRFFSAHSHAPGVLLAAARRAYWVVSAITILTALPLLIGRWVESAMVLAILAATLAFGRYNLLLQVANAQGNPLGYTVLSWVRGLASLGGAVGFVLLDGGAVGAVAGFAGGHLLAIVAYNPARGLQGTWDPEAATLTRSLLRYGLPLTLTFAGTLAVDFADRFLIGAMLGVGRVGPYAAAYDLALQSIGAITNVLFLASFPKVLLELERDGEAVALLRLRTLGRSLLLVALPAAAGFGALAPDIAAVLLGAEFRQEAIVVMPVLATSMWISGFKSYYLDAVFQVRRATSYQAYVALVMMVVNVGLNLLLLRPMGIMGAAWATLGSILLGSLLSFVLGKRKLRLLGIGSDFLRAAIASAFMVVALRLVPPAEHLAGLVGRVLGGAVVYGVAALLLNVADVRAWLGGRLSAFRAR